MPSWLLPIRQILTVYEAQREHAEDDVASHLELANWCRKHRLPKQERAHLSRVLQLNSNHRIARKRLGYRLVNGQWVSNSELWQAASQSRKTRRAFRKWQPELKKLLSALDSRNEAQWLDAKEKLLALGETEAIPAIEVVLLSTASRHASLALAAINNIPQHQASLALARQAVVAPHESLRRQAVEYLADRSQDDYVPALIDTLKNPMMAKSAVDFVDGRLYYRHVLYQESRDQRDVSIMDTRYARQRGSRPVSRGIPLAVANGYHCQIPLWLHDTNGNRTLGDRVIVERWHRPRRHSTVAVHFSFYVLLARATRAEQTCGDLGEFRRALGRGVLLALFAVVGDL